MPLTKGNGGASWSGRRGGSTGDGIPLQSGTFITLATQKFEKAGILFFLSRENRQLLHSSDAERDDFIVDVLMSARKAFRTKALVNGGGNPSSVAARAAPAA
ncbi:hypothetical protein ACPCA8_34345 [Streptomyces capoamus]|uniref:hypothetical protein n=1 Tax=Streptomyces capoamus TaxID=68183 RepID=UPI003C2C11D3